MSIASQAGHLTLSPGFEWIGTWPALFALAAATTLEVIAYFTPWLDNLLDSAATPAAIVAGVIVTGSQLSDISPILKWSLAIIAGGGASGAVQASTVVARAGSTVATGGLGNVVIAFGELIGSITMTILAIVLPLFAFAAFLIVIATAYFSFLTRKTARVVS